MRGLSDCLISFMITTGAFTLSVSPLAYAESVVVSAPVQDKEEMPRLAAVSRGSEAAEEPLESSTNQLKSPQDGVYLFGQSPQPEQIGYAYLVFEVQSNKVIGAFYLPRSSFDCFFGTLRPNKMDLTVIDSYEQTARPYAIAVQNSTPVATSGTPPVTNFGLQGYYPIEAVSQNDRRILAVCKTDYQEQDWQ